MTLDEHKTAIRTAVISGVAVIVAGVVSAIVSGVLGFGPSFWTDLLERNPKIQPRTLSVTVPDDGRLPASKIDVTVPDARPKPGESLWLGVQNLNDTTWYLRPCTTDNAGKGTCSDITVGLTVTTAGRWRMKAVIVNDSGHEKIVKAKSEHTGSLYTWLDDDLVASGDATGHREPAVRNG
ncbi:hypothetical protein ACFY36_47925 [Actinoplanes sp. NPDC000266]